MLLYRMCTIILVHTIKKIFTSNEYYSEYLFVSGNADQTIYIYIYI